MSQDPLIQPNSARAIRLLAVATLAAALAACGGGGSGGDTAVAPPPAAKGDACTVTDGAASEGLTVGVCVTPVGGGVVVDSAVRKDFDPTVAYVPPTPAYTIDLAHLGSYQEVSTPEAFNVLGAYTGFTVAKPLSTASGDVVRIGDFGEATPVPAAASELVSVTLSQARFGLWERARPDGQRYFGGWTAPVPGASGAVPAGSAVVDLDGAAAGALVALASTPQSAALPVALGLSARADLQVDFGAGKVTGSLSVFRVSLTIGTATTSNQPVASLQTVSVDATLDPGTGAVSGSLSGGGVTASPSSDCASISAQRYPPAQLST